MSWRKIQKTNITKAKDLIAFLELDPINAAQIDLSPDFPLNLPLRLASKIKKNCLTDPLFLQYVATKEETKPSSFPLDPTEDRSFQLTPRLLKKYHGRALLMPSPACGLHCRYCFRRNYSYETSGWEEELSLIRKDPSLIEIILSGGDPLSLSDEKLQSLLQALDEIDHLKVIRFHTRFPIGIPERITPQFTKTLSKLQKRIVFITHINHPSEIDEDVKTALQSLQSPLLLNQAVLLKGVNDSLETLTQLSHRLIDAKVTPYYLHQLDQVNGAAHFEVDVKKGRQLIKEMQATLPGYFVPKYVHEVAHEKNKLHLI